MPARRLRRIATALCGTLLTLATAGCDPPSRYGPLNVQWQKTTGRTIAATPSVGDGKVYVGSWDGYEYALDQATGSQSWRTFLGQQNHPSCGILGITSAPALVGGSMYLGGGDAYWYALNASTGGVQWRVFTGDPANGHYNWSTPAVHNGHAYVGVSSLCDTPLVQGKLLRVNLATGQVVNTWKVVPDGQLGGTIWTTPVIDPARNTVYVTTGNRAYDSTGNSQLHAEALVALDATTLAIKGYWSLPVADPTPDADWGTAPTFSTDSLGRAVVSAGNKNGVVYAFLRDNVSAGPIWHRRVAEPAHGADPAAGGLYSNGYFDGKRLLYAGGLTTVRGERAEGSIRALDPRTGGLYWEQPLPTKTYGALTGQDGMVVVPSREGLRVFDQVTGEVLYGNELGLYAAAKVFGGRLFIGDVPGVVRAFTFPAYPGEGETPAATTAAATPIECPPNASGAPAAAACELTLAEGCQRLQGVTAVAASDAIRVSAADRARNGPATVELHAGPNCSGQPEARMSIGARPLTLQVPEAYRTLPARWVLSAKSSRPVRLKLAPRGSGAQTSGGDEGAPVN